MGRWTRLVKQAKALLSLKRRSKAEAEVNARCNEPDAESLPEKVEITPTEGEWITTATSPGTQLEVRIPIPSGELEAVEHVSLANGNKDPISEERAAVMIQSAFRGAMARKKLKALRAFARLKSVLHGRAAKKQTSNAMRCIQSFAKVQCQVKIQRARMSDFQAQKRKEQDEARKSTEEELEDWNHSVLSKEQISAQVQRRRQAAAKRERTLAYAFSHQLWRSYPRELSAAPDSLDEAAWSWSWLEQWMSSRNWGSLEESKQSLNIRNGRSKHSSSKRASNNHIYSNGHAELNAR